MTSTTGPWHRSWTSNTRTFSLLFWVFASISCLSSQFGPYPLALASKTIPILLGAARVWTVAPAGFFGLRMFSIGLMVCAVADLVIEATFIGGLLTFFIAHGCYIVAMGKVKPGIRAVAAAIPALMVGGGMAGFLHNYIPDRLYIPVMAYIGIITIMYSLAWNRALITRRTWGALYLLVGASSFVLSDSLIAINRWSQPLPYPRLLILTSYYFGQYLLARGAHAESIAPAGVSEQRQAR